ncbi:MAG: hypothetical protein IJB79_00340 [Candidatus Gastranaerophilales bacterium]|nr:hypothetical protein [Candidatus Gastranaerophilales bacterium]
MRVNFHQFPLLNKNHSQRKQPSLLNRLEFDTFSFQGKIRAVYAINKDGTRARFDSAKEASTKLGIERPNVYNVLQGISKQTCGYTFVWADEVEYQDESGKIALNEEKMLSLLNNFSNANNFELYSLEFDGTTKRHENITSLSIDERCSSTRISDILGGRVSQTNGYVFIRANDVDLRDEKGKIITDNEGNPIPDKKKINKLRETFLYSQKNFPIVVISKDKKTRIFPTIKEAGNQLPIAVSAIIRALNNPQYGVKKCAVARLSDVVLKDSEGNVVFSEDNNFVLDDEKLQKTYLNYFEVDETKQISFCGNPRKIYAYDYEGNSFQFDGRPQAAQTLGMSRSRITDSIRKEEITHGYVFALADDIEMINDEGESVLDLEKVQKLMETFSRAYSIPICTIGLDGKINRYLNYKDAQQKVGIPEGRISDVIYRDNRFYESKGILIVKEPEILLRDEYSRIKKDKDGNYLYDLDKVSKLMEGFMTGKIRPIIARNCETDEVLTFKSATEAARYFNLSKTSVDDCLKNKCLTCAGHYFDYYDKNAINDFLGL